MLFLRLRDAERTHHEDEFQRIVDERVMSLEREMALNIEALFTIQSLFAASDVVDYDAFTRVPRGILSRHPNIQALEWVPRVLDFQRDAAETARRGSNGTGVV
jgi:CHASE1-domain containing sensor protein